MTWTEKTLGDLIQLQRGHDLPMKARTPGIYPVVGSNGILSRHEEAKYAAPGVLIGRSGVIGGSIFVNEPYWPLNTTLFVRDFRGNDPRWVYYLLKNIDFSGFNSGSAQPSLNRNYIAGIELQVPTYSEQCAIAATLGALDDKIESNRRAVSFLFKIAIATLSGGEDRVRLGDVATIKKGLSYKGAGLDDGTSAGALPMLNLASFTTTGELKGAGTKWYTGVFKPQHVLSPWEVVLANTDLTQARELLGRGFLVPPQFEGALHTHHTSVVRFFERSDLSLLLWAQLQSAEFRDRAKGFATGTTVAALPPEAVLDFELTVPTDLDALLKRARLMIEKAWQLERESETLKATRDELLPELLSGRIRAADVEVA